MKRLPLRTLFVLVLILAALATRLPARGGFVPSIDQPGSCAAMPYGLVGCWSGDGNATDTTGNHVSAWDGTPRYEAGVHGSAFKLTGWEQIVVPDAPDLQFTSAFTLAAWIKPSGLNAGPNTGGIFAKVSNSTGMVGYQTGVNNNNQQLGFAINSPGEPWPGSVLEVNLSQPLPIGQWTHVAFSFDGNRMRIHVNGQLMGTTVTGPKTIGITTAALRISGDGNNNSKFLGAIDEAAAFNRALSDAEIAGIAQLPLHITTLSVPHAALNQAYAQTIQVTGGTAPYTFSVDSGSLPAGLSLSWDGVLSGTLQQAGLSNFTVRVDDAAGHTNTMPYAIHVLAPNVTPSLTVTSDGRFGSASRYFFDNYAVNYYIHTDSCQIYQQYSNYPWDQYTPQPAGRFISQPNGPAACVLDFTDFVVNMGNSALTVVGSHPLVIATQGDVSIRGNIRVLNNGGVGGTHPEGNFDVGNPGSAPLGSIFPSGGSGGWGAAGVFSTTYTSWGWDILVAASGGGGGGAANGADGADAHTEYGAPSPWGYPLGAPGGSGATADVLQGGGGGGQGGYAHTWYCCYTGGVGANGGGAVMFQSGGNVLIQANSSISADGQPTPYYQGEVGGGGAGGGGYVLFDAAGSFENRGVISARGGAGTVYTTVQTGTPGAGGRVVIRHATSGANSGTIDVSGGSNADVLGGEFNPNGIGVGGTILGIGTRVLIGTSTGTGTDVITNGPFGSLAFNTVTSAGVSSISTIAPYTGGPYPVHYTATSGAFEVSSTATYSGPITVCFYAKPYAADLATFNRLRILHLENGALVDRTILAPNQPAPDFATGQLCANPPSLSPFYIALAEPSEPHTWRADYNFDYQGLRTSADTLTNAPYQFKYGWHFGIFNGPSGPLDNATISVNTALTGLNTPTAPDALPYTWMRQLDPATGYSVDLGSNIDVPQLTPLGYDVARQLVGGRTVAANATETRTFTLAMAAREAAITHLGAVVDFNGVFGPAPATPVTASNITCAGPGLWEFYQQAQVATPAVHWQVGENSAPETVVVNTTYTLTCTVTLTNTSSNPVSYMPAMLTEGQIHYLSAPGSNPQTVSSNLAEAGPVDPLGNVTYSTTTPANAFIDKRFQRTVIFDGENHTIDIAPPVVTLSAPVSADEGTPVTILANAVDQSPVTYAWSIVSGGGTLTPNGASAIYQKRQPSSSTIRVKVTDAFGNATTKQVTVQITNVAPTVNVPGGGTVTAGQNASASASFSDPGNDGPWTASVNYGDGSPSEVLAIAMNPDNRSGVFTLSHAFAAAGDPVVIVTVTDIFGAVGTASIPLHVVPNTTVANPTPVQVSPSTTVAFDSVTADGVTTSEPIAPSSAPALPGAFVSSLFAYEVSTTATVTGPITVCFTVPAIVDEAQFSHLRVLHGENGVLVDRTVLAPDPLAPNFAAKTLCARTSSLSPFVIAEIDSVAPVLTVNDVTVTSTDASGVIVDYAATATDDHSTPSVVCSPTSGSLFAIGATTVNCTATDDAHNSTTTSFVVTVLDGVAPSVSLPALPPVEATSPAGAVITFSVTTADNVGVQSVTCTPASGSVFPIGTTTITCTVTDLNGNIATASAIATVTPQPSKLATFVAFSQDGTWLRNNVKVVSGSIGANDRRVDRHGEADDDNDRDDATVRIGENTRMLDANSQVVGNVVVLLNKASVYNVTSNTLFSRGLIQGTTTNTVTMPYLSLPSFPTAMPGAATVDVKKGKTQTLAAGAYGKVHVAQGATLILTGGLYQMLSLDVDEQATVLFRGPSELRIKTELDTNNKSKLILDQSVAGLKASQMVIYVEGADQACAHDGRDEDGRDNGAASVHIGEQNVVQANIRALNGTLWIKSKTQATGAFIGRHVRIGQNVTLTLDSAWR